MVARGVVDGRDVEEERFYVVVEGLVVEEEFGQQAELLAVQLRGVAVHFENGDASATVNLIARWIIRCTLVLKGVTSRKKWNPVLNE